MNKLQDFYTKVFKGTQIPFSELERLAVIAEDVIYDVCNKKPTEEQIESEFYKRAICYEMELLYQQGGVDSISGFAESLNGVTSESLGGYSVSGGGRGKDSLMVKDGIPVSPLAISQLRRLGLMSRWLYSGVRRG